MVSAARSVEKLLPEQGLTRLGYTRYKGTFTEVSVVADLDPCTLLRQADQAWFDLNVSGTVRSVTDQNGERIEYSTANRAGLLSMIQVLQGRCPEYRSIALGLCRARPIKFLF